MTEKCTFCEEHEQGDTLYGLIHWDVGLDFQYIQKNADL